MEDLMFVISWVFYGIGCVNVAIGTLLVKGEQGNRHLLIAAVCFLAAIYLKLK